MNKQQQVVVEEYKHSLHEWFEIIMAIDADFPLQEQVYYPKQVSEITHLFMHVISNYMTGEMLHEWCTPKYIHTKLLECWSWFKDFMMEHTKLDTTTFPYL